MKQLILLFAVTHMAYCVDIGVVKPENYDWDKYVTTGESEKDKNDRLNEVLEILDNRYAKVHDQILDRVKPKNRELFADSEKKWKEYRNYTVYFLGSKYDDASRNQYMGLVMVKMTCDHLKVLASYESEYFGP